LNIIKSCLFSAVTESGQVFAWGDNDHGQQGNATTTVNRKPALVHGLEGHRISRVACGSSHSVSWTSQDTPSANCHEPVLFTESKDPLGAGFVTNNTLLSNTQTDSNTASSGGHVIHSATISGLGSNSLPHNYTSLHSGRSKPLRPSLARIILSLESNAAKQQALQHILNALQILYSREAVVSALIPHGGQPTTSKMTAASNSLLDAGNENKAVSLASPESPSDIDSAADLIGGGPGGGEAPACPNEMLALSSLQTTPDSEDPSSSNSVFGGRGTYVVEMSKLYY
jgi:hypothetical protein